MRNDSTRKSLDSLAANLQGIYNVLFYLVLLLFFAHNNSNETTYILLYYGYLSAIYLIFPVLITWLSAYIMTPLMLDMLHSVGCKYCSIIQRATHNLNCNNKPRISRNGPNTRTTATAARYCHLDNDVIPNFCLTLVQTFNRHLLLYKTLRVSVFIFGCNLFVFKHPTTLLQCCLMTTPMWNRYFV